MPYRKGYKPRYRPCPKATDGKHRWERLTRNLFEKCQLCGEPGFAVQLSADESVNNQRGNV